MTHLVGSFLGTAAFCLGVAVLGNRLLPVTSAAPTEVHPITDRFLRDTIEENWKLRGEMFEERCRTADLAAMVARDRQRRDQSRVPYVPAADDTTDPADLIPAPAPQQAIPIPAPPILPAPGRPD